MNINLSLENKQINPGVINLKQFTTGTDTLVFEMDSFMHETTDLSKMSAYTVCDMSGRIDEVKLTTSIVEDKLRITWHVTGYTTDVAGTITYQIVFKDIENEKAVLWTSHKAIIFVNSSIQADDHIAAKYPSILQQWEERMNSIDTTNKENFDNLVKDVTEKIENGEFDGKSVIYGEENPSDEIGNDGDVYIKTTETEPYPYYLFTKDNGTWTPQFTVRGKNGYDGNPIGTIASFAGELPEGYEEVAPPFCNENILDNADFRYGAINQEGKTTYNVNGIYTIDMWRLVGSTGFGGKVTVGEDNILLENNGNTEVYFVNKSLLNVDDGNYFIYVNVIGLGNSTANVYCDSENGKIGVTKLKQGENFIKITGKPTTLGFELLPTTRLRINMVKLERGEDFTGMPKWNKAQELLKCQRYFYYVHYLSAENTSDAEGKFNLNYVVTHNFHTQMNKVPVVTVGHVKDIANANDLNIKIVDCSVSSKGLTWVQVDNHLSKKRIYLNDIYFDARDY